MCEPRYGNQSKDRGTLALTLISLGVDRVPSPLDGEVILILDRRNPHIVEEVMCRGEDGVPYVGVEIRLQERGHARHTPLAEPGVPRLWGLRVDVL